MQKQAPTVGRMLVMVGFALSCFGLLLFLWLAFGGPIRRGLVVLSCSTAQLLDSVAQANPQLGTLVDLLNAPSPAQICPKTTQAAGGG